MSQLNSKWGRFIAHAKAWFIDHEILRIFYRNFHKLSENAYRSNHPSPSFIRKLKKKYGIKTIISMRRADKTGQYLLEKEACEKEGITLINFPMSSRSLPNKEQILEAKNLLETVEYPILIHCKSGADRAGLMSVFYRHFIIGDPISKAFKQLGMKYGHFRWADTGKLDYLFDNFLAFQKTHSDISFVEWVTHHYDKSQLNKAFKSAGWANLLVNRILHRE